MDDTTHKKSRMMHPTGVTYCETRLFRRGTKTSQAKGSNSVVSQRTAEETFQKDGLAMPPPTQSLYQRSVALKAPTADKSANSGAWITVIGVIPGRMREIIDYFSKFGAILRVDDTPGNWACLEMATRDAANAALEDCGSAPVLVAAGMACSCVNGKVKSEYLPDNEEPPTSVEFDPCANDGVQPKKWLVSSIFDSIFGM